MKVVVTNLLDARDISNSDHGFTHVISILDTRASNGQPMQTFPKFDVPHLQLRADDVLLRNKLPHENLFTLEHGLQFKEFIKDIHHNSRVLIHCHGGISRSPTLAFALIAIKENLPPEKAMDKLLDIRGQSWPNEHIIAVLDHVFNMSHTWDEFMAGWLRDNANLISFD